MQPGFIEIEKQSFPSSMTGVCLVGHGGFEKLQIKHDIPLPKPSANEVLIRVSAAAVNNTDINTRIGWYSKKVDRGTNQGAASGFQELDDKDATWTGEPLCFPRIQGADCCGRIVAVGDNVDPRRVGERVLVRNMLRSYVGYKPWECWTFGSECDGAFAQYTKAPACETYNVECSWLDIELASIPCSYSTAECMMHRAKVAANDRVLITGGSGGVGSAAIQLAKRRGATVIALASPEKTAQLLELGADEIISRDEPTSLAVKKNSIDVVIDLVAGSGFSELLEILKKGGRYAVAGAIGGPLVELDVRTLYLKDLTFLGCTFQEDIIFANLIEYIERDEIRPVIGKVYPLDHIAEAQKDFLAKKHVGKLVLEIP